VAGRIFSICFVFEVKGCVTIGDQKQLLRDAGFTEIDFFGWNGNEKRLQLFFLLHSHEK